MRTSDSTMALVAALVKAHAGFTPIVRDRVAHVSATRTYTYADLGTLLDAVLPALLAQGVTVLQSIDAASASLITRLAHISGEWVEASYPLQLDQAPQALGSALTYGRRYSLQALLCVSSEDDDDGAAAHPRAVKTKAAVPPPPASVKPPSIETPTPLTPLRTAADFISDAQRRRLFAIARERGWDKNDLHVWLIAKGIGSTSKIRTAEYDAVIAQLQAAGSPIAAVEGAVARRPRREDTLREGAASPSGDPGGDA